MLRFSPIHALVFALSASFASSPAQAPATPQSPATPQTPATPPTPGYTLDVGTRLVIEDVSVTDKHGNPVTGLPQSAFHIQDDGAAQQIQTFNERSQPGQPAPSPAGNTYSNASLYGNTGTVTAMLIDPVSMSLTDGMYLRLQMLRYLKAMPEGTPVAIFRANRDGIPVLIQSLTPDRPLLIQAVNATVPSIPRPSFGFAVAVAELENVADYLRSIPGKKNLLWFAGRFPLYLDPDRCNVVGQMTPTIDSSINEINCSQLNDASKAAFRAMQAARVAVYPIDVRGVLIVAPPGKPPTAASIANTPGSIAAPTMSEGAKLSGQYDLMEQLATSTGGRAYYSNNDLVAAMTSALDLGERSYTLAYSPQPYRTDGRWHKVRISVDGGYTVRYRTGYYSGEPAPPAPRPELKAGGLVVPPNEAIAQKRLHTPETEADPPIVFTAHVQPQGKAGKTSRFAIEYSIPARELAFSAGPNGTQHARFRLAVLAYNSEGDVLSDAFDTVETSFSLTQMQTAARIGTPALQTVDVPKGSGFLLLAVQDLQTQRVGTVQIPLKSLAADTLSTR